jgi:uncharacterized protein (TIGR02147 family)
VRSVFTYTDFRKYIRNWYDARQQSDNAVSYRAIAGVVGLRSPAYITLILQGKTRLPNNLIPGFCKLFKFKKRESAFFELLVKYNQSGDVSEKKRLYGKMVAFSECGTTLLNADQHAYYQKWYYSVIHDILSFYPFNGDFRELARMVEPSITARQAKCAVALLERLEFIRKDKDGQYTCLYPGISAYTEGHSMVLSTYAGNMIDQAKYALEQMPAGERLISWAGFSVSSETFKKIKEEARAFRKKLIAMAQQDTSPGQAFHLNLQVFPVSKKLPPSDTSTEEGDT